MSNANQSAARRRAVIAALRMRTVSNGCTPAEAEAAYRKIEELEAHLVVRPTPMPKAQPGQPARAAQAAPSAPKSDYSFLGTGIFAPNPPATPSTSEPEANSYSFAVSPDMVTVLSSDEWAIAESIVQAFRQLGPRIGFAKNSDSPRARMITAMVPHLLNGGELRDRAGNVLESVEFNGKVYTKQAPQPEPAPLPTGYGIPINLATPPVSVFPTWMKNGW